MALAFFSATVTTAVGASWGVGGDVGFGADVTSAFGVSWGVCWDDGCNVGWGVGCCGVGWGIGCGVAVAAAVGVGWGVAVGVEWVAAVLFAFETMPNNVGWFVGGGVNNWGDGCVVGCGIGSGAAVTDAAGSVLKVFPRVCGGIDCGAAVAAAIGVVG